MVKPFPRILLAVTALLLAAGGLLHAKAFNGAAAVLSSTSIPVFYANSFKALWLIDSATLICLAVIFAFVAARPGAGTPSMLVLLAFIPAATAVLLYTYVGAFFPVYMLVASALAAAVAGLQWRTG